MPTAPLIDIDALLAPIAGDQPAGARLQPDKRKKMEDARKEFEPNPDDPSGAPIPKKPDWAGIIKLASDVLQNSTKDLLVAARMTEALSRRHGFAGLKDGLTLLKGLVGDGWDRIHPVIEEEADLELRAGPFEWLSETESGALFPQSVRMFPLVRIQGQAASCFDWNEGKINGEPFDRANVHRADPFSPTVAEDIGECLSLLDALESILGEKMSGQSPSLVGLREAVGECQRLLGHLAPSSSGESSTEPSRDSEPRMSAESSSSTFSMPTLNAASGRVSREEVYRQISRLADILGELEPHSPIPDLLKRAVELGSLPFRQLIKEIVREETILSEIRRQFGIKESE